MRSRRLLALPRTRILGCTCEFVGEGGVEIDPVAAPRQRSGLEGDGCAL